MSRTIENDCVSCPDGCKHCGRGDDYILVHCDWCDDTVREEDFEREGWHQITVTNDIGEVSQLDLCDDCHTTFASAVNELMGSWDTFKAEHKESWARIQGVHTSQAKIAVIDKYLQELFDTLM